MWKKSNENLKTNIPSKKYGRSKTTREYLARILTKDGRCTSEIKCRIAMAKLHSKRKGLFLLAHCTWN